MLVVFIDPSEIIFPILGDWAHQTLSGEFLLVGALENEVRVISPGRNSEAARMDLAQKDIPAVMAVDGITGVVDGRDYRGQRVMAYVDNIPNSPWWLVAKKDRSEILAVVHNRVRWVGAFLAILLISLALLVEATGAIGFCVAVGRRHEGGAAFSGCHFGSANSDNDRGRRW
jgi:hypothetical protein